MSRAGNGKRGFDRRAANLEGWDICESGDGYDLVRLDGADAFADDEAAMSHVVAEAWMRSRNHGAAISLMSFLAPQSRFSLMMDDLKAASVVYRREESERFAMTENMVRAALMRNDAMRRCAEAVMSRVTDDLAKGWSDRGAQVVSHEAHHTFCIAKESLIVALSRDMSVEDAEKAVRSRMLLDCSPMEFYGVRPAAVEPRPDIST